MKYLDFHQHYGFLEYRGTKINIDGDPGDVFEKIVIEKCKKLDMVVAVNGCGVYPISKGKLGIKDENNRVEKFFKKYPDYIIGMAYIDLDSIDPQPECINKTSMSGSSGWFFTKFRSNRMSFIMMLCQIKYLVSSLL